MASFSAYTFADDVEDTVDDVLSTSVEDASGEFQLMPTTTTTTAIDTTIEVPPATTATAAAASTTTAFVDHTNTTTHINSTSNVRQHQQLFKYAKGSSYENADYHQSSWKSRLFEQKLASTRWSLNEQPRTTTPLPITTTTPKYNLRNLSLFGLTSLNYVKTAKNQTANFKEINKLAQLLNNEYVNESTRVNQSSHGGSRQFENAYVPHTICNCSRNSNASFFDEYTNVWKLSFFVLAFVIGFVSLFLLLSLIFRVIIMHLRKFNIFGSHTYKLQTAKSNESSKVSSISLFEADSDNYLSNDRAKGKNRKRKSKSRRTTARRKISSISKIRLKNERILYGVSNRAFSMSETPSKYVKEHKEYTKEYMLPFDMTSSNALFSSFVKEDTHSSFRPFTKMSSSNANVSNKTTGAGGEGNSSNNHAKVTDIKEVTIIKRDDYPTYQPPWKQCNDYEALETTTATGSVTNLSSITSLSEALSKHNSAYAPQQHYHCSAKNANNNEIISRCSKITEELELKLKERRMLTEGTSGDDDAEQQQQKSINEKKQCTNEKHHINSSSNDSTPHHCSCPCHCHHEKVANDCQRSHSKNPNLKVNNYNKHQHQVTTTTTTITTNHTNSSEENMKQTTQTQSDENSSSFNSPAKRKRESIRKLMENKAVSENKQKHELERHLTSMLISRINSCEVLD